MNYHEFSTLLSETASPVVLLEGTRDLPADLAPALTVLAAHLARTFPHARFRTGNANGSDEAFAAGVASVDPGRIEFVLPYVGHRKKQRHADSPATAIDEVPTARLREIIDATIAASPRYQRVAENYLEPVGHPRQRAAAQLLLRDTLKVLGSDLVDRPVAALFFVHAADPDRGGTGHTIRVCRAHGVPVSDQSQWLKWDLGAGVRKSGDDDSLKSGGGVTGAANHKSE